MDRLLLFFFGGAGRGGLGLEGGAWRRGEEQGRLFVEEEGWKKKEKEKRKKKGDRRRF